MDSKQIAAIALLIAALAVAYYFVIAIPRYNQQKLDAEAAQKQSENVANQTNQTKLLSYMALAQGRFETAFELNSYKNPQLGHPDSRTWNSNVFKQSSTKQLNEERDLCAKLYGDK